MMERVGQNIFALDDKKLLLVGYKNMGLCLYMGEGNFLATSIYSPLYYGPGGSLQINQAHVEA